VVVLLLMLYWLYWAWFKVSDNTSVWATVFTGQKTQPTVSKYWRNTSNTKIQ